MATDDVRETAHLFKSFLVAMTHLNRVLFWHSFGALLYMTMRS